LDQQDTTSSSSSISATTTAQTANHRRNLQKTADTTTTTTTANIFELEQDHHHDADGIIKQQQQQQQLTHEKPQQEPKEEQEEELLTTQQKVVESKQQEPTTKQEQLAPQQQQQKQQKEKKQPKQRYRRVVIEGSTRALFFCPTCKAALQAEQDAIWKAIQAKYHSNINNNINNSKEQVAGVTLVRAKQDLINALFVRIPILSTTQNIVRNLQQQQPQQKQYIQLQSMLDLENNDHAMDEKVDDDTQVVDLWLQSLPGVVRVSPSEDYQAMNMNHNLGDMDNSIKEGEEVQDIMAQGYDSEALYPTIYEVADYLGSRTVSESSLNCLTGQGIRVAILDTGVDYTHSVFGGSGTAQAYQQAYGAARNASENTERQSYFPTSHVVAGIDYVGDGEELISISDLHPDADPIDSPTGHGTKVASAVIATAPNVELIAIKVCSNIGACPDYSMVDGLEYAIRQGAHIANCTYIPYTFVYKLAACCCSCARARCWAPDLYVYSSFLFLLRFAFCFLSLSLCLLLYPLL
jgi:hypothetical protein